MKNRNQNPAIVLLPLLLNQSKAQAPNLGIATSFTVFTASSAVNNMIITQAAYNISTSAGALAGMRYGHKSFYHVHGGPSLPFISFYRKLFIGYLRLNY